MDEEEFHGVISLDGLVDDNGTISEESFQLAQLLIGMKFHFTFRTSVSSMRSKLGLPPPNPRRTMADALRKAFRARRPTPNYTPSSLLLNPISAERLFKDILDDFDVQIQNPTDGPECK